MKQTIMKNNKMKRIIIILLCLLVIVPMAMAICNDDPNANRYTGNSGIWSFEGSDFILESTCLDDSTIVFPYCSSGELRQEMFYCYCFDAELPAQCTASVNDVFHWITYMDEQYELVRGGVVTEDLINAAIESWVTY